MRTFIRLLKLQNLINPINRMFPGSGPDVLTDWRYPSTKSFVLDKKSITCLTRSASAHYIGHGSGTTAAGPVPNNRRVLNSTRDISGEMEPNCHRLFCFCRCLVECWLCFESCHTSMFTEVLVHRSSLILAVIVPRKLLIRNCLLCSYELLLVTLLRAATSTSWAMQLKYSRKNFSCVTPPSSSHYGPTSYLSSASSSGSWGEFLKWVLRFIHFPIKICPIER